MEFYGFQTPEELFWNWQFTQDALDESKESYKEAFPTFIEEFGVDSTQD